VNEKSGSDYSKRYDEENGNVFISGVLDGRLTVAAKNDIYITGYDPTVDTITGSTKVFSGVKYKDTVINLNTGTGDITVNESAGDAEADMLGLVADNYIAILTRGWFKDGSAASDIRYFSVYAAVYAGKSFINSDMIYGSGSTFPLNKGTLTVRGAIIQNTRGAVGDITSNTGYTKDYAHDPRMSYDQPPHFMEPTESGWEIRDWKEID
jgi:hypothetical protein